MLGLNLFNIHPGSSCGDITRQITNSTQQLICKKKVLNKSEIFLECTA